MMFTACLTSKQLQRKSLPVEAPTPAPNKQHSFQCWDPASLQRGYWVAVCLFVMRFRPIWDELAKLSSETKHCQIGFCHKHPHSSVMVANPARLLRLLNGLRPPQNRSSGKPM